MPIGLFTSDSGFLSGAGGKLGCFYFMLSIEKWNIFCLIHFHFCTSLVAQTVKRLLTTRETWVRFLGQEDPLEKDMATHSSILAWRIPWTEEPGGLHVVHGITKSRTRLND